MGDTKKVHSTGRFGVRYGVGIRKRVLKIEQKQKQKYRCPNCMSGSLKRIDRGIFVCKKCSAEFAGGTFVPQTLTGGIIKKMVNQKKFLPYEEELLEVKKNIETEEIKKVEKESKKNLKKPVEKKSDKKGK